MTTIYFDDQTRTRKPDADGQLNEPRAAAAAGASTQQRRAAAREIPRPGVNIHRQQPGTPWAVAHANPGGDHSVRPTENGVEASAPGRCSCGRHPVQWLDSPQGPKTVPYCGRPLGDHHGPEVEAAAWETPEPTEPTEGDPDRLEDESPSGGPEPTTVAYRLADDANGYPQPRTERVGAIDDPLAGGGRR